MNALKPLFYPLALLLPAWMGLSSSDVQQSSPVSASPVTPVANNSPKHPRPELGFSNDQQGTQALRMLERAHRHEPQNQVRIERRIIVRVSPASQAQRERMLASLPRRTRSESYAEVEHEPCVGMDTISAVQPVAQNRLLLFMRDRRILSARLERACNARAFYAGFYVERSEDGDLCVLRDLVQSRMGMACRIESLHSLVAVRD